MVFFIFLSPQALNDLKKLNNHSQRRILISIEKLAEVPQFHGKKMKDMKLWSLRSGKYRIIFEIDNKENEIRIHAIGHRKKIYKKLQ